MKNPRAKPAPRDETIILLHGILRSQFDMLPLTLYLRRQGYDAVNILYPSRKKSIEDLTDFVHEKITAHTGYAPGKKLSFVAHSMGSLIARYYIEKYTPENLGRVVMLGPPNTGSEFADILTDHKILGPAYAKIFGPAAPQLTTRYALGGTDITYPVGVIAGTRSINPLALWALPKARVGAHDGIVPVERTKLAGMRDHITVPTTHTFMMFSPAVMRQVLHFLENEKFKI